MNQQQNGEQNSPGQNPQDKLKVRDDLLDQYESKVGLPTLQEAKLTDEVQGYLSLTRDEMDKLSPEDCAEIGTRLEQAAFHIQRFLNKEVGHVTWAKDALRLHIADRLSNYRGSFTQQEAQAIKEDGYATKLNGVVTYAQQRADRLAYLSTSLTRLADRMYHLQQSKSRKVNS